MGTSPEEPLIDVKAGLRPPSVPLPCTRRAIQRRFGSRLAVQSRQFTTPMFSALEIAPPQAPDSSERKRRGHSVGSTRNYRYSDHCAKLVGFTGKAKAVEMKQPTSSPWGEHPTYTPRFSAGAPLPDRCSTWPTDFVPWVLTILYPPAPHAATGAAHRAASSRFLPALLRRALVRGAIAARLQGPAWVQRSRRWKC